ncbi:hypothetical protein BWQ96_04827 [Gracilariopsis chorda]|uniref:Uncharacterized protein n=1 Tax=Gracilariopsis chorda TaxID=448386 RepID=A0A2V3ITI7_9FLOR|nr:hypothetical protein BWQ96_04827 [Gracilariopsis chorda]|eukprot:PXF45412.1 hypothetical protein BWQ96_04827 [Gracilariopsis chorda]
MDANHVSMDAPNPPNFSATAQQSHPSNYPCQHPNIGQIWTELATITVQAFTPQLITRLRAFISKTPCFDLDTHLQMLGPIVVRHIALTLAEPDQCLNPPSTARSSRSSISRSNSRTKRRSYRDIAYHAVRINRIVPHSIPLESHRSSSSAAAPVTNSLPRRLSIQKAPSLSTIQRRASKSAPDKENQPTVTTARTAHAAAQPAAQPSAHATARNEPPEGACKPKALDLCNRSVALREETCWTRTQNRAHHFPRADVTTRIEPVSTAKSARPRVVAQPQNLSEYASRLRNDSHSAVAPISRLVQMRKQRAERKRQNVK